MIVDTSKEYNSSVLSINIKILLNKYPFLKSEIIGTSVMGKPIYSLIIGSGVKHILYFGSIHANEWIVSPILMKFVEDFCIAYSTGGKIAWKFAADMFKNTTIHVVPMLNPDGVDLVTNNFNKASAKYTFAKQVASNYPEIPFPSRLESKFEWCRLKFTVPCRLA